MKWWLRKKKLGDIKLLLEAGKKYRKCSKLLDSKGKSSSLEVFENITNESFIEKKKGE